MKDIKIITPVDTSADWNLDIDIIDGYPTYVQNTGNTQDQRAALAAYTVMGTIPGALDTGVDWGALYTGEDSLISIDNQVRQNITDAASSVGDVTESYTPMYTSGKDKIQFLIYKAGIS